jgi:hypothetical protein
MLFLHLHPLVDHKCHPSHWFHVYGQFMVPLDGTFIDKYHVLSQVVWSVHEVGEGHPDGCALAGLKVPHTFRKEEGASQDVFMCVCLPL